MGIGHFAVGVTGGAIYLLLTGYHEEISQDGYVLFLSGIWAVLPDLGQPLPGVPQTDHSRLADLFWFHYALDTHAMTDSIAATAAFGGLMVLALVCLVGVKRWKGRPVAPIVNDL